MMFNSGSGLGATVFIVFEWPCPRRHGQFEGCKTVALAYFIHSASRIVHGRLGRLEGSIGTCLTNARSRNKEASHAQTTRH
jgi:hypothetical protein